MRRRGEVGAEGRDPAPTCGMPTTTWRPQRRRGLRRLPAAQDRRAVRPRGAADRAGCGLPARRGRRLRRGMRCACGHRPRAGGQPAGPADRLRDGRRGHHPGDQRRAVAGSSCATRCCTRSTTRPGSRPRTWPPSPAQRAAARSACRSVRAPPASRSSTAKGGWSRSRPGPTGCTALLEPGDVRAVRAGQVKVIDGARLGTPDSLRVVGLPVPAGKGQPAGQTVLVAVSQAEASGSVRALAIAICRRRPDPAGRLRPASVGCWWAGRWSRSRGCAPGPRRSPRPDPRMADRLPVPAAQDEVQRLAETLNGMLDRLEGASAAQRAFVADAAHELRSPLSAIRTQLEVARRHPDSAPWEETADGVLADTDRLARLVDDLLLLARSEDRAPAHRLRTGRPGRAGARGVGPAVGRAGDPRKPHCCNGFGLLDSRGQCTRADPGRSGRRHADPGQPGRQRRALRPDGGDDRRTAGGWAGRVVGELTTVPGSHRPTGSGSSSGSPGSTPRARGPTAAAGSGLAIVHRLVQSSGGTVRIEDAETRWPTTRHPGDVRWPAGTPVVAKPT